MKAKTIIKHLNEFGYYFDENNSRMNYGFIGSLIYNDNKVILIFPETIYVLDKDISLTNILMSYIKKIQKKFKELKKYDTHMGRHTEGIHQEIKKN